MYFCMWVTISLNCDVISLSETGPRACVSRPNYIHIMGCDHSITPNSNGCLAKPSLDFRDGRVITFDIKPRMWLLIHTLLSVNTLRPRQNGRHFPDDIFKWIFLNENVWISINISLKFVPRGQINNIPTLVQIMAWRRLGDKPLSEPMMVRLPTHVCVTRPQWVNLLALWWHMQHRTGGTMDQIITWIDVDFSRISSSDIYLGAILQETPTPSITRISQQITYPKFHLNLPGANELIYFLWPH